MKPRLRRPLLAAVVTGALFAGGAAYAGPAFAATPAKGVSVLAADPAPSDSATSPTPDPSGTTPTADPSATTPSAGPSATTPSADPSTTSASPSTPTADPSATTPSADPTTTAPAEPDNAPRGWFSMGNTTVWYGQPVSFTQQSFSDDHTPADQITRVVNWGDGATTTLSGSTAKLTHNFNRVGSFKVSETFTDGAGQSNTYTWPTAVSVSNPAHIWIDHTAIYPHATVGFVIKGVPAGTTKIALSFGDGFWWIGSGKDNQVVRHTYYTDSKGHLLTAGGAVAVQAFYTNHNGQTSAILINRIAIYGDKWAPTVTITKPAKPTRVASWSTLRGTVHDAGSGVRAVHVIVMRASTTDVYCYTPKATWLKLTPSTNYLSCLTTAKVSGSSWSIGLKGLKGGGIAAIAVADDWVGNEGDTEYDGYIS